MSNPRISIAQLKQIIQFESSELSAREIGRALNLSHGAVSKYRCAVRAAGMKWEEAQNLDDAELERRIWQARTERATREVVLPDCTWIHTELKRHKHVTLQLLWDEYHATHGKLALRYSSFCERYRHWVRRFAALDAPAALCWREIVRRLCALCQVPDKAHARRRAAAALKSGAGEETVALVQEINELYVIALEDTLRREASAVRFAQVQALSQDTAAYR